MKKNKLLLFIAMADAYGRVFEFNTPEFAKEHNTVDGYKHREGEESNGIGIYTDDTQMSLGIAEQMISIFPATQVRFSTHFTQAYQRDPRGGYSKRIKAALEDAKLPFQFILNSKPAGANSNGSVMRTVPLGLLPDTNDIMHRCIVHTSTSHGSLDAINATVAVSLTAHYFYHVMDEKSSYTNYCKWMEQKMGNNAFWDVLSSYSGGELPCDAKQTASLSIKLAWGLYSSDEWSMSRILYRAIDIGGDVDSSAAVALGLYSLRPDAIDDLPIEFYNNLENGAFGRDYIVKLDNMLFAKFPKVEKDVLTENIV